MAYLCLGSFARVIHEHSHLQKLETIQVLYDSFGNKAGTNLHGGTRSELFNSKESVTDVMQEIASNAVPSEIAKYFNNNFLVTNCIPPQKRSKLLTAIQNIVENDLSIAEVDRMEILSESSNLSLFLAKVFLFAIMQENDVIANTRKKIKPAINSDDEIARIITVLESTPRENRKIDLEYDVSEVSNKIKDNNDLVDTIINENNSNYGFIDGLIKNTSPSFQDQFSKEVKDECQKWIDKKQFTASQIYDSMVAWLKNKATSSNDFACQKVIAYFVQHCEVFKK